MRRTCLFLLLSIGISGNLFADNSDNLVNKFSQEFPHLTKKNEHKEKLFAANGSTTFEPSGMLFPRNDNDVLAIIDFYLQLKKDDPTIAPMVMSAGGRSKEGKLPQGWSFDGHAHGQTGSLVINTKYLRGLAQSIDWQKDLDPTTGILTVEIKAGSTWRETLRLVNNAYAKDTGDAEHYFVPFVAPTGSDISIGGCLASNSHARASSVLGGYFADTIEGFTIASVKNGHASLIPISKVEDADLFNAVVGSFGRGGLVTSIHLKLQRVNTKKDVVTQMRTLNSIEELTIAMKNMRQKLMTRSHDHEAIPFLATGGVISTSFDHFMLFDADFFKPTEVKPPLPIFTKPTCSTEFIYWMARNFPKMSDRLMHVFMDWHASDGLLDFLANSSDKEEVAVFHNRPLDNYIFFQDGFTHMLSKKLDTGYQTGHLAFVLKTNNLPLAYRVIRATAQRPQFSAIHFELQDVLPVSQTKALMSAGHTTDESDLLVYTISFGIDEHNVQASAELKIVLENALYDTTVDGQPLAWLLPSKEFSYGKAQGLYRKRTERLEQILQSHGLKDRVFLQSQIQKYLYKN